MKKYLGCLALVLALGGAASAQIGNISNPVGANLNVQDAGVCLTGGSNLTQQLPINASTSTVTLAGTFTATVLIRESNNGGVNWTTAATLSSAGTTSYSTNGFSHLCVDVTAYTSGVVQATILTGILQVQSVVSGGSSVTPNSPVPAASQQGPAYNVMNFAGGVPINDAKSSRNCATTQTSTITSTDNPWVAGDVGKKLQHVVNGLSNFGTSTGGDQTTQVTISAFNSAGSISVSPSVSSQTGSGVCVWYTAQAHTAMLAAYTAADVGAGKGQEPGYQSPTLVHPGSVFIPRGGYVVCGTIYNDLAGHAGNNTEGVSLIGEPGVDIYVAPCFVAPNATGNAGVLIGLYLNQRAEIGHIAINGMNFLHRSLSAQQSLVSSFSSGNSWIHDLTINDWSTPFSNDAAFQMVTTSGMNRLDNLRVQGGAGGTAQSIGCFFDTVAVDIFSSFCSNHFINFKVNNSGARTVFGPHFVLHGYQNDECGTNALACFQVANSTINCLGCELLNPGGGVGSMSLDTTSVAYLTDSTLITYDSDGGNSSGIVLAGNAQVFATASNISGNNASAAIAGPATSKFWDLGGNLIYNQVTGVLTPCTVANFLTCAFSGGVTPIFPLLSNATTQLGARQVVTGTAPTFAVTGFGTGPTVTVQTGSTDAAGAAIITAGTTPTATGTFTLTFTTLAGVYGTNAPVCTFTLVNGTGSWNALAQEPIVQTPTTSSIIANWANNAVALTAASTYGFNWSCYGK